jgi:hypothetical protein
MATSYVTTKTVATINLSRNTVWGATADRRSRGDLAEHVGLIAQRCHVRDTTTTGGELARHLTEQPTTVVTAQSAEKETP